MNKTAKSLITAFLAMSLLLSAFVFSFAAVPSENGTYSVPVTLYHSEKDKESMGNKYILQTALISVENGKKTITVIADGVDNLTFSYYTNGSVEGETKEAVTIKNVKIGSETYPVGYSFPLVTDNEYVGVKFKAPIMPMSPSARLKINYSAIKPLDAETTTQQETSTEKDETNTTETELSTEELSVTAQASEPVDSTRLTETETQAKITNESASVTEDETETAEKNSGSFFPIIIAATVIAAAVILFLIVKKKR